MTSEEYLREIERVVRDNFEPSDPTQSMTVARLGLLVRKVTGLEPGQCGFYRFKDALSVLEQRGIIRTGFNSKQAFAFWLEQPAGKQAELQEQTRGTMPAPPSTSVPPTRESIRRLRGPLWFAFVGVTPQGRRFFHRTTGEVAVGQRESPAPIENWVEIHPVNAGEDKADAVRFLESERLDGNEDLQRTLDSPIWFHEFVKALQATDPHVAFRWKRRRSLRVIAEVEKWRAANELSAELIYDLSPTRSRSRPPVFGATKKPADLREIILDILEDMPTQELLNLRVPIRDAVAALRPDLLRQ